MEKDLYEGEIYYAQLNDQGLIDYPQENILQIMTNDIIVFHLNPGSPIAAESQLLVNQPQPGVTKSASKVTTILNTLKKRPSTAKIQDTLEGQLLHIDPIVQASGAIEFVVKFPHSGSFFYQIQYFDKKLGIKNFTQADWIVVHPLLKTPNRALKAESMIVQTVFSRCLGKVKDWPKMIESQAKLGYNAIHFVPIQKYGCSGSMYSLKDQVSIDDCYFDDPNTPDETRISHLHEAIKEINNKSDMLCFIDIVMNHTAVNSDWLVEHPDSAYNLHNCPFLKVAWEFDKFLSDYSRLYAQKKVPECKYAPYIGNESDLAAVMDSLRKRVQGLPLEQYFLYNREWIKSELKKYLSLADVSQVNELKANKMNIVDYVMKHSSGYGSKPYGVIIDIEKVGAMLLARSSKGNNADVLWNELNNHLNNCDNQWKAKYQGFMKEALGCIEQGIRYEKLQCNNPELSDKNPLVRRYFTELRRGTSEHDPDEYIVAHNGWVMKTEDFATPMGFHYLRRLIVIWDDSVKLYYGAKKEDSPYLWSHMEKYVGTMAEIFQGLRIDNCHSTPLHVLEYFVNYAHYVNPTLFVFAELFSNDAKLDASYVRHIGLNALIRESVYIDNAWSLADTIRKAIASAPSSAIVKEITLSDGRKAKVLNSSKPKALIYDITHDNNSSIEIWNAQAILPLFCSLAMTNVPIGSTRGVDEFVPKNLSVVTEKRIYQTLPEIEDIGSLQSNKAEVSEVKHNFVFRGNASKVAVAGSFNGWSKDVNLMERSGNDMWQTSITLGSGKHYFKYVVNDSNWVTGEGETEKDDKGHINNIVVIGGGAGSREGKMAIHSDLRPIRKLMNEIHCLIGERNATMNINTMEDIIVISQRLSEVKNDEDSDYVLIARTNFAKGSNGIGPENILKTVQLPGKLSKILLTCNMNLSLDEVKRFSQDSRYITGVKGQVYNHLFGSGLKHFANVKTGGECDALEFFKIPNSLCVVVTTKPSMKQKDITEALQAMTDPPVANLSMGAFNHLLFRSAPEEREFSKCNRAIYEFKGIVPKYAGIAGLVHEFNKCKNNPNACDSIFDNIKEGNWLIDYHLKRIQEFPELTAVYNWMNKYLSMVKGLPSDKPKWFVKVIERLFDACKNEMLKGVPEILRSNELCIQLLLSVYHFMAVIPSAAYRNHTTTMAAGLPHFTTDYMRCWGRDTLIALPGLLIIPNKLKEAREILIMFAEVSRHGLIPNLHCQGTGARFNARDATWFFLEALQQYVNRDKENGPSILKEKLDMQFLSWDQAEHFKKAERKEKLIMPLEDLVQQIMQAHFKGIDFVEWNAGKRIDEQMTNEGFRIRIGTDHKTGFIYGGNKFNCGTWMDKMGSSEKARNKGVPGSSRDGADIEIIGLLRSTLRFLCKAFESGIFPYEGVKDNDTLFTYKNWAELLDNNFEKYFWIPKDSSEWGNYHIDPKLVQQTEIYKDLIGASDPATEYRFRPNMAIALTVAPEMFNKKHAQAAIDKMKNELVTKTSLGIKTLHSADRAYRPRYVNDDDGTDFSTAHGLCYHMGPEWVWPYGHLLKAIVIFEEHKSLEELKAEIMGRLENHRKHMLESPWMGLPELTNADGEENPFSCMTQAWSSATIIDAVDSLYEYHK